MLPVEWSDEAQLDLVEVVDYIEQHNATAAASLQKTIENAAERLPQMPFAFRPGRVATTREYVVHPNYIIIYRVEMACIKILRILHARRQYP